VRRLRKALDETLASKEALREKAQMELSAKQRAAEEAEERHLAHERRLLSEIDLERMATRQAGVELAKEQRARAADAEAARSALLAAQQAIHEEKTARRDAEANASKQLQIVLSKMKPAFKKDGMVTAGNASGINDGAAAVVLAEGGRVQALGLKPLARLLGYAHAGVEPAYMGMGPVPATRKVLERTGLKVSDLDVIASNEAFAAQACAVMKELGLDPAKVNPNGSGISLGHPVGATGPIITTKAIAELHRTGGRYALVTMCIGGGQGIAAVLERWF
jgi:acetyl-CoA C-acetyltransferase